MAAENLADLHNFQQHFEQAAKSGLFDQQGLTVFVSRDYADPDVSLPDEMLSVNLAGLEAVEVRGIQSGVNFGQEWVGYQAELLFMVRTIREDDIPVPAETIQTRHNDILSKVRASMLYQSCIWDGRLPYYDVTEVKPGLQVWDSEEEIRLDQTTLPYTIQFLIRQDAWPSQNDAFNYVFPFNLS